MSRHLWLMCLLVAITRTSAQDEVGCTGNSSIYNDADLVVPFQNLCGKDIGAKVDFMDATDELTWSDCMTRCVKKEPLCFGYDFRPFGAVSKNCWLMNATFDAETAVYPGYVVDAAMLGPGLLTGLSDDCLTLGLRGCFLKNGGIQKETASTSLTASSTTSATSTPSTTSTIMNAVPTKPKGLSDGARGGIVAGSVAVAVILEGDSTWTEVPQETSPGTQQSHESPASVLLPDNGGLPPSNTQAVYSGSPGISTATAMGTIDTTTTMKTTINVTVPPVSDATPISSTSVTTSGAILETVGTMQAAENDGNTNRLSAGEVTGVAIGTFILGAILAYIAALFLFKQRNKHKSTNVGRKEYPSYADSAPDLAMMQSKSASSLVRRHDPYVQVSQTPIPAPLAAHPPSPISAPVFIPTNAAQNVTAFLPPAADNEEVWNRVSHLFASMHEHVENHYRDVKAVITPSMEPEIGEFGAKEVDMAELLEECSNSTAALKHALVAFVLDITGPKQKDENEGTLFPVELYTAYAGSHNNFDADPDLIVATSLHRRISVYLYSSITGMPNRRRSWMAQSNVREAAEHFSLTFFPWANPTSSDQDKDEDLTRIITATLAMRIWLFGQLDSYEFQWEGAGERSIVINPGLVKRKRAEGDGDDSVFQLVEGAVVAM
ncbi:hypothetical protein G6011_07238 [Alternaria panax]|uniref:Apple domain-containing protein n=1 Tax=Alternaria panax TaxID=48097 RepID=A0AAD4I5B9_9PLEO|nr:hypothetical protein G6011_07238 [Alternaria panax]